MISVNARNLNTPEGWQIVETSTSVSLKPIENLSEIPEDLEIEFFARRGNFTLWFLSQSFEPEIDNILFRIINEEGNLIAGGRASIPHGITREWISREHTTEDLLGVQIPGNGKYRLIISLEQPGQVVIDKIHLTRNNEHPPSGFGYPETTNPNIDALLARRDIKPQMPPADMFGVIEHDVQRSDEIIDENDHRNIFFSDISDLHEYGYVTKNLKLIGQNDFYQNKDGVDDTIDWLGYMVESVANQRMDIYEAPFVTADLTNIEFSEMEWIRWLQFSAFNSLMYIPDHLTPSLSEESREISDFYKNIRQELFPYLYSTAHINRTVGMKLILGDAVYTDQYMLGDALLVAPSFGRDGMQDEIRLPRGKWYNFWNGTVYEGRQSINMQVGINTIPVFVKAGSIIPFYRKNTPEDVLSIEIFGGGEGAATFRLYEDDGLTNGYLRGEYTTTAFRFFENEEFGIFTIGRKAGSYLDQQESKRMNLHFKHIPKPVSITISDEELDSTIWTFDGQEDELVIEWIQSANEKTDFHIEWE